jgi:fumarate hydratase subunit alpha
LPLCIYGGNGVDNLISNELIKNTTIELLRKAVTKLPEDVEAVLKKAYENEEDEVPKMQLKAILDNMKLAEDTCTPMCQDTGIHVFYVNVGNVPVKNIEEAIRTGVEEATELIPLRPNAVHPLTRKNPGTNIGERMPYINYKFSKENYLEITVFPKGAGSENMSALAMLTPSQGIKGIKEFVLDTVVSAGGKPCPPIILGIGIGGSADISMKLAKESLLRPIDERHEDEKIASLEEELLNALNLTGIGPMGLGGKTSVLGVNIEYAHCHTASFPVAINIQCWAARRATARIYSDGKVKYTTHKEG